MVQLYNCHPFGSQRIVPTKQAPEVFCCGRDSVFVTCAGGCKVEVFSVGQELCQPLCSFNTLGKVVHMSYSDIGDYLVTIEEKNNISSLRAYVNWRCQTTGSSRVSVRMVGLQLESLLSGASKDQMEIIEMPLSENPLCLSCCPVRGDLLVGCKSKLMVFNLKYIAIGDTAVLDFDRSLVLHINGIEPSQLCFCSWYIGIANDLEVLVFRLSSESPKGTLKNTTEVKLLPDKGSKNGLVVTASHPLECEDFVMFQRPEELVGEDCKSCNIVVTPEPTGLSIDAQSHCHVNYILYRRFAPDFTDGFVVESTRLHSLQLLPMYKTVNHILPTHGESSASRKEISSLFCFFSMPHAGFLYTLFNAVELISVYQYPERSQQAVLTSQFLHVITSNNLQCFTVRCCAAAAREEDPYIGTTMKTCPPVSLDVCTLRMQLFIGLKAIQHFNNYIIILTKADIEDKADKMKSTRSSRKAGVKNKSSSDSEHGWNLYVVSTTPTLQLYKEMVEYSKRYETVKTHGSIHLLSEAHLLLRAALINPDVVESEEKEELMAAFRESCAYLGDCFSSLDTKNTHLALPYYKMSGLSVSDVIERVLSKEQQNDYGKGFIFYLKHSLYEELDEKLSETVAFKVLQIFSATEPNQLPHALCSSCMINACPKKAMGLLETLRASGPSALISLTKAAMALKLQDLQTYEAEMQRHSELQLLLGFLDEPRLILRRRDREVIPTEMAFQFRDTLPGLLVAVLVAFHENSKINLKEAESFFKTLCNKTGEDDIPQLLVDFWEARLSSYPPESILQDVLLKLTSHYVLRLCQPQHACIESLKSPEDLRNSCSHFGLISPWISKMVSSEPVSCAACGELLKLQSLLCGPSLDIVSFLPFLDFLPDSNNSYLSIHIICATRLLNYEGSIERLLDQCPEAVTMYAKHEIKGGSQALWWNKLLPELCNRVRSSENTNAVFISSLKDTLDVIAMELDLHDFLNLLPDDGNAAFFLPYLVNQSKRKLAA
ncbi:BLOC-2 complex member HPS3 isoform X2 [Hyla sarda]|uniref:BLOC-2 complex member HPS3 isoform X2 n=1 Tax=Hyla sarda TaxID=327740 RepID=UPI0024C392EC|nr:BLOC-2 complex member HPS3 isoform X2 [Hyla sarda]